MLYVCRSETPTPCVYMKAGIYPRTRVNLRPVRHSRGYYLAWVVIYISYQLHNARLPCVPGLQPRSVLPTLLHPTVSFRPSLLSRVVKGRSSLRLASLSQPHMSGEVSLGDKFIVSATPTSPGTVPPRSFQHAIQTLQVFYNTVLEIWACSWSRLGLYSSGVIAILGNIRKFTGFFGYIVVICFSFPILIKYHLGITTPRSHVKFLCFNLPISDTIQSAFFHFIPS
ncbi:hypothetical protein F5Y07DRAFT_23199 [Xylaria sp. FL0933]|nr:hypothetical protein F5Y07DRAFT_23199 [Xylaria sp. FL0933]